MIIAITGHRPDGCEDEAIVRFKFSRAFKEAQPEYVIYGGADGCDLWAADEARALGIPIRLVKPWGGHKSIIDNDKLYTVLQDLSEKVHVVSPGDKFPGNWCYFKRNEFMVDHATHVLAYLDPATTRGGTLACRNYAKKVGKPVKNIFEWPPF